MSAYQSPPHAWNQGQEGLGLELRAGGGEEHCLTFPPTLFSIVASAEARSHKLRSSPSWGRAVFPSLPVALCLSGLIPAELVGEALQLRHSPPSRWPPLWEAQITARQARPHTWTSQWDPVRSSSDLRSLWPGPGWLSGR